MSSRSNHYSTSVFRDFINQPYNPNARVKLYKTTKDSLDWVQRLTLSKKLPIHNGCVNCICWSEKGDKILSGSDDQHLIVTDPFNYQVLLKVRTAHRANIFSAKFLPRTCDTGVVSCSGDGAILYTDLLHPEDTADNMFTCHGGTAYDVVTVPGDPHVFLTCGEDFTVRSFDLRVKTKCSKPKCIEDVIICCRRAVTALAINPIAPYELAIGCAESTVRIYDRRMAGKAKETAAFVPPGVDSKTLRITSLCYSENAHDLLVSYSSDHLYLFDLKASKAENYQRLDPWSGDEGDDGNDDKGDSSNGSFGESSSSRMPTVKRLRLRGDWSDTGPLARPHTHVPNTLGGRSIVHGGLIQRMSDVLSRMLSDPTTRAALSHGGEITEPEAPAALPSQAPPLSGDETNSDMDAEESAGASGSGVVQQLSAPEQEAPPDSDSEDDRHMSVSSSEPSLDRPPSPAAATSEPNQDQAPEEPQPSTSTGSSSNSNLTNLSDELSSMFNGFEEKYGRKPMVNLMYSAKGSTASTISMTVEGEASTSTQTQNLEEPDNLLVDPASSTPPAPSPTDDGAGDSLTAENGRTYNELRVDVSEDEDDDDDDDDDEDDDSSEGSPAQDDEQVDPNPSSSFASHIESEIYKVIEKGRGEELNAASRNQANQNVRVKKACIKMKYMGHRNARTMIKEAVFWGSNYVMSGSDCGHVLVWDKHTGMLQMMLQADAHVVNCIQPHPYLPLLATSGIDYDVKLWEPLAEEPSFDLNAAQELMARNAIMLEETKDTITVPASFMIRMLACLNQLRTRREGGRRWRDNSTNSR